MSQLKTNAVRHLTASSDALTFDSSGNTTINGTATVGGATNLTITDGDLVIGTAGHGIDFSATTDGSGTDTSELLDDYEEGTWTPAVTFGGASTGVTYGTQEGRYTKIGRLVYATLHITLSNKGTSTGSFLIHGLPYNVGSRGTGCVGYYDTIGTIDDPMVLLATNPDKIAVYGSADTNAPNVTNSNLNNTSRFYFTIIYEV